MVGAQFSQKTVLLSLVGLASACISVSLLGFRLKWGIWPGPSDMVMGLTLLAPFALLGLTASLNWQVVADGLIGL